VFVMTDPGGALRVTTRVSTSGGSSGSSGPGWVQVMSGSMVTSHTQPVPLIETNVNTGSRVSVTVIGPVVVWVPLFETLIV